MEVLLSRLFFGRGGLLLLLLILDIAVNASLGSNRLQLNVALRCVDNQSTLGEAVLNAVLHRDFQLFQALTNGGHQVGLSSVLRINFLHLLSHSVFLSGLGGFLPLYVLIISDNRSFVKRFFRFFLRGREGLALLILYDLVAVNACLGRDRLNLHITGGVVSHNRALGHGVVLAVSHIVASSRQSLGNDFHNLLLGGILGVDLLHFLVSHSINSFLVYWVFLPCDYIVPQFRRFVKNFF